MAKFDLKSLKKKSLKIVDTDFTCIDGKFLRDLRIKLNMSQLLFASYLGVSKKAIEKWEQGTNKINAPTARLLYLISKDNEILSNFKKVYTCEEYELLTSLNNDKYIVDLNFNVENQANEPVNLNIGGWESNPSWETKNSVAGGFKNVIAGV